MIDVVVVVVVVEQYAHRRCVQRWCNEKGDTTCEICHQVLLLFLSLYLLEKFEYDLTECTCVLLFRDSSRTIQRRLHC